MSTRRTNGPAIRVIREALGRRGNEVAIAAGMTPPHLINIEKGRRQPTAETVEAIARVLAVPVEAITYEIPDCPSCRGEVAA